jgi:hypothetical protein
MNTGVDLRTMFFEQLVPSKIPLAREMSVHVVDRYERGGLPPQENFSIILAKSCNLRTSDPIIREKCCLEKSHFYTEQSLMITFFIPEYIIWCHFSLLCCMPLIFYAPMTKSRGGLLIYPLDEESGGLINLPPVRPFIRPDIDTWFVWLSPPTVSELQL